MVQLFFFTNQFSILKNVIIASCLTHPAFCGAFPHSFWLQTFRWITELQKNNPKQTNVTWLLLDLCCFCQTSVYFSPHAERASAWWLRICRPRTQTDLPLRQDTVQCCTADCRMCHCHSCKWCLDLFITFTTVIALHTAYLISPSVFILF